MNLFKTKPDIKGKHDPILISHIQPAGNLLLSDEKYIQTGDGFTACLQIYSYPSQTSEFWLTNITGMDNVIAITDIATEDKNVALKNLSTSMAEVKTRIKADSKSSDVIEAEHDYRLMEDLLTDIQTTGEQLKLLVCRLYVSAGTREELEKKVAQIIKELDGRGYRSTIFLNETEFQYRSILLPYTKQQQLPNKRDGAPLSALALAGGYPFNYENLDDEYGQYLGVTETGGNVIFDIFQKTKQRLSYDALIIGKKGSGKSTLLKKLLKSNATIGNYVRVIDVTGEFTDLVHELDGKVITMDGTRNRINPLEVFKTAEDEETCFAKHLSKLNTFYKFIDPGATSIECNDFEGYVRSLYVKEGLWNEVNPKNNQITGLKSDRYPVFSDLLDIIQGDLYVDIETGKANMNFTESRRERLERIESNITNIVSNYGNMFNKHTTLHNLSSEKIIAYNIMNISGLKLEVYNSLLYNVLSLLINDMIAVGSPSKNMFENGVSIKDIPKLLLIIDEAHKIISTKNPLALDEMIGIVREGRKYFTGLVPASQSIRDFAPEHSDGEGAEKLKTLFELMQYKFIMQQDANSTRLLKDIFVGELTESQFEQIPMFEMGDCVLSLGNSRTINMHIEISNEEQKLFRGGA